MTTDTIAKGEKTVELEARIPHDVKVAFWYDRKMADMPESEQEHVIEMLEQGYVDGELNYLMPDGNTENRGWWRTISRSKQF